MFIDVSLVSTWEGVPKKIATGQFLSNHWNFEDYLPGFDEDEWEEYSYVENKTEYYGSYGVCDSPEQFNNSPLGQILKDSPEQYVVSFVQIRKDTQTSPGGWRWHKWGEYIGKQNPQCEYIADEPEIEEVYTYHFYKKVVK